MTQVKPVEGGITICIVYRTELSPVGVALRRSPFQQLIVDRLV